MIEDTKAFVATELPRVFTTGVLTKSWYADNMKFEDPLVKFDSFTGYNINIQLLRALLDIKFDLHDVVARGPDQVVARWTMEMVPKLAPWRPSIVITGQSFYQIDLDTGKIFSHVDTWDCLENNSPPNLQAALEITRQLVDTSLQRTPDLETPQYTVLLRTADYEIRQYKPFLVAETPMSKSSGVSAGEGFNELAGYIFGGNKDSVKMEMTTPVFTETAPGQATPSMQFVLESKFGSSPEQMPKPNDTKVVTKEQQGGYAAAVRFSGLAFDWEVREQERRLRVELERAGYRCRPGYRLARYNEPFVLPAFRRNEVLIDLEEFAWP